MSYSTNTAPPCVMNLAWGRLQQRRSCVKWVIRSDSLASRSSLVGAGQGPSPCPPAKEPGTRQTTGSISKAIGESTASSTSLRSCSSETRLTPRHSSTARPPRARPREKPDEPTNVTSPTASSDECGETNEPEQHSSTSPLDKGASDSPGRRFAVVEWCAAEWRLVR